MRANHPALVTLAAAAGFALVLLALLYWIEPAGSLPGIVPGHQAGSGHHHVKHGLASLVVGLALLVFAWFQTGAKRPTAA